MSQPSEPLPSLGGFADLIAFSSSSEPDGGRRALESHGKQLGVMEQVLRKVLEEYYIEESDGLI